MVIIFNIKIDIKYNKYELLNTYTYNQRQLCKYLKIF